VLGFLEASLADYAAVRRQLDELPRLLEEMGVGEPGVFPFQGDAVEALVALGKLDGAKRLVDGIEAQGGELDRPRLLALAWRGRGLLHAATGEADKAAEAFANALAEHERLESPLERARTLLAQGIALRRGRQKRSARAALEDAVATFDGVGAAQWAERARGELGRVGGRAPSRGELTPTERRVAELAAAGRANKEIAAELYVTVRTVETHLTKIYTPRMPGRFLICAYTNDGATATLATASLILDVQGAGAPAPTHSPTSPAPQGMARPANVTKPRVRRSGGKLLCNRGRWRNSPSHYSYRWLVNGRAKRGARGQTLRITRQLRGRRVQCTVTASNAAGATIARSRPYWS
jgi:DNA-binding CsgD family transcriptional regulator